MQIVKPMGSTAGAIFVTAEDPSGPTVRFAQRYDLAAGILTPNIGNDLESHSAHRYVDAVCRDEKSVRLLFDGRVGGGRCAFGYALAGGADDGTIDVQSTQRCLPPVPILGYVFCIRRPSRRSLISIWADPRPGTLLTPPTQSSC